MVSPDGKYLFYWTYHDIYWVRVDHVMGALRARVLATGPLPGAAARPVSRSHPTSMSSASANPGFP